MANLVMDCIRQQYPNAKPEIQAELSEFSFDGLIALEEAIENGQVMRGSWEGCPISYKKGCAGSVRRDRCGRAQNHFTMWWDNGYFSDAELLGSITIEKMSRMAQAVEPDDDDMVKTQPLEKTVESGLGK